MKKKELPPYDPDGMCPKCGCDDVGTHYFEDGFIWGCRYHRPLSTEEAKDFEHHHRHCTRCHFGWPEAILAS